MYMYTLTANIRNLFVQFRLQFAVWVETKACDAGRRLGKVGGLRGGRLSGSAAILVIACEVFVSRLAVFPV